MSQLQRWLDDRRPPMPMALRRAVADALVGAGWGAEVEPANGDAGTGRAAVADALAEAGLAALERVVRGAPGRAGAAELLAADALLTFACEAAAEAGPDALDELMERLDYGRFAALLPGVGE